MLLLASHPNGNETFLKKALVLYQHSVMMIHVVFSAAGCYSLQVNLSLL